MASPTFDLTGLTKVYARTSRSVVLTADGLAFSAGTDQGTVGSCPLDLAFADEDTDKFCLLYEIDTVSESTGATIDRTGYIGFADVTTDPFTDSNGSLASSGEWAINGSVSPAKVGDNGTATAVTGLAVGDGAYVLQWFDLGAKKGWTSIVTPGSPATITQLTPDGGSLGDPVTGANPQHTWTTDNSNLRWGVTNSSLTRVTGYTLLTAEEASAIGLELPEGWALAGEAASLPATPTSVSIVQGSGTNVDVTWDSTGGDSVEFEIRSSLGEFTGTPTQTGITDDGAHSVDVGSYGIYYVKVRIDIGGVKSLWSDPDNVTTTAPGSAEVVYSDFVSSAGYGSLAAAVAANDLVIIPVGTSTVSSTIELNDASKDFYIHGVCDMRAIVSPSTTGVGTTIKILAANSVHIAGIKFAGVSETGHMAIESATTEPCAVSIANCYFEGVKAYFGGPDIIKLQQCFFDGAGNVDALVHINNSLADCTVIGGNLTNYDDTPTVDGYHVHCQNGRLRVYSTALTRQKAYAAIRIDNRSTLGPHIIAGIRTEGTKNLGTYASDPLLVHVPTTTEAVDIALIDIGIVYDSASDDSSYVIDYNGAGTVWAVATNSKWMLEGVVKGTCPDATIVAVGNRIYNNDADVDTSNAANSVLAYNIYDREHATGDGTNPDVRWIDATQDFSDYPFIPPVPAHSCPDPVLMPVMDTLLPGFVDVTAPTTTSSARES